MKTEVLKINDIEKDYDKILKVAGALKNGQIVAIPTETVYGLAANMYDENAVKEIFIAKGRPQDNPLIVHICDFSQLYEISEDILEDAIKLAKNFWPGPLTIIVKRKSNVPDIVTAGLETVAVRFPAHQIAHKIIEEVGKPLVAPSANLSGRPSTTSAEHCINDLSGKVPFIVDGGDCEVGLESTIIDMSVDTPTILRPGAITFEQISKILPNVIDNSKNLNIKDVSTPKAPGMKYRHYAPKAPVMVVVGTPENTAKYISENATKNDGILCFKEYEHLFLDTMGMDKCQTYVGAPAHRCLGGCGQPPLHVLNIGSYTNPNENAQKLFSMLREFDKFDVNNIFVQCPEEKGIGVAIYNRLKKAANENIIILK